MTKKLEWIDKISIGIILIYSFIRMFIGDESTLYIRMIFRLMDLIIQIFIICFLVFSIFKKDMSNLSKIIYGIIIIFGIVVFILGIPDYIQAFKYLIRLI